MGRVSLGVRCRVISGSLAVKDALAAAFKVPCCPFDSAHSRTTGHTEVSHVLWLTLVSTPSGRQNLFISQFHLILKLKDSVSLSPKGWVIVKDMGRNKDSPTRIRPLREYLRQTKKKEPKIYRTANQIPPQRKAGTWISCGETSVDPRLTFMMVELHGGLIPQSGACNKTNGVKQRREWGEERAAQRSSVPSPSADKQTAAM